MKKTITLITFIAVLYCFSYGQQTEILSNSEFSAGTDGWWYMGANVTVSNGEATFNITEPGSNPWDIQICYNGLTLKKGYKYTFSWRAKRESGTINFLVQLDHSPYTYIFGGNNNYNNDWQEGTAVYENTIEDIIGAGIAIHMGGNTATAVLDYISLKEEPIDNGGGNGGGDPIADINQRGYYDAPYKRYEADAANMGNGAYSTSKSYNQADLQYEASDHICVNMNAPGSYVEWNVTEAADGIVVRYSIDLKLPAEGKNLNTILTGKLGVYVNNVKKGTLDLTTYWSWEDLRNNDSPNAGYHQNANWRKRFDETRIKLNEKIPVGGKLKLVQEGGDVFVDYAELEPIEDVVTPPPGAAIYNGNGSDLQSFVNRNAGKVIYLPPGIYTVSDILWFNKAPNTKLQGAGMWYTQLHFDSGNGGLWSSRSNVSYADLYLTTDRNSREYNYHAIRGAYDGGATIERVWTEHFECGAWISQFDNTGIPFSDGLLVSHCRFRNSFADGLNLSKGSVNCIVEHCSFRSNGDDDMAIWCADGMECINNTFRYCTSENGWRAGGASLYGGKDNKFHNLLIKDPYEAGIQVNNGFEGVGFNQSGMHEFRDITIISGGTKMDVFNQETSAILIMCKNAAGDRIRNVRISNIDIIDAQNDAISIYYYAGYGMENFSFENINVNGTGREYPFNNVYDIPGERGFLLKLIGDNNMNGYASYCNLNIQNRGGNATKDVQINNDGPFSWTENTNCPSTIGVTGITLSQETISINWLEHASISAEVFPQNASNKSIIWSSDNEGIATVTQTGVINALSEGTATIKATTLDGNFADQCVVTVKKLPIAVNNGDGNPLSNITGVRTYLFDRNENNFKINEPHNNFDVDETITFAFDADENLPGDLPIAGYTGLLDWLDADPYVHFLGVNIWRDNFGIDFFLQRIPNTNVFVSDLCLANLFGNNLPSNAFTPGTSLSFQFSVFAKSYPNGIGGDVHWKFVQPLSTLTTREYNSYVVEDFESKNIGYNFNMKRYNESEGSATVKSNPADGTQKSLEIKTLNWDTMLKLNVTLPSGKVLADYSSLIFDVYLLPDSENNYKKMNVFVDGTKIFEDEGYPYQAPENKWTVKEYKFDNLSAGNNFVLEFGLSTPNGNYYIDNIRLKPKYVAPVINKFQVTASVNSSGMGSVTGAGTYNENTNVTMTATPNSGYKFVNWTKNGSIVSTALSYSFNIIGNTNLVANFAEEKFELIATANPSGGGTVIGAGSYSKNANVKMTATPNSGYKFVNWTKNGIVVSTALSYTFTITGNTNLVANFAEEKFELTATANPSDGGTITGTGSYQKFANVIVTAVPKSGYRFVYWTKNGNIVSSEPSYFFTITANTNLIANFASDKFVVTVSANPSSGGKVSGSGSYSNGSEATLLATANPGYKFVNWTNNGVVVSSNSTYSFKVTGNINLTANFEPVYYDVQVFPNPSDAGTVTGEGQYLNTSNVTVVATPKEGFKFVNWTKNDIIVSTADTYSFNISGNTLLIANFDYKSNKIDRINSINSIKLYPNPSEGLVNISGLPDNNQLYIALYSIDGRTMLKKEISNENITTIDISMLSPGIYQLRILGEKFIETQKIVRSK
jgi:uncharacterized protein YjdB